MAVILAYGSPALGHLYPLSALLCELAQRGHQVHLRTMSTEVATMRRAGFHTEAVDPRIEAIVGQDWLARNALGVLKMSIDVLCRRAVIEVDDIRRAITRVQPDVVIVDANCWGAMSVADADDVPWLVFSPYTPYLRSRGMPPFGPGLRPLPRLLGVIRDTSMRPFVRYLFDRPMLPRVNVIRAQLGVQPVKSVDELMRRAPLLLAVGGEPFEYPHPGWGDAVQLIGACVFEPTPAAVPGWMAAIDRPVVLVSTSSIAQADAKLGRITLRALADEPVHVVATFPAGVPRGLPQTPNATVCQFVPHSVVLDRAICAVTHGGWAPPSRPSTAVSRSVWCPLLEIKQKSPAACRWPAAALGCRRRSSQRNGYGLPCARRRRWLTAHAGWPPVSPRLAVWRAGPT
jgi:UDP:flavonoid glycosyltransferase YjiC (YdhE family)